MRRIGSGVAGAYIVGLTLAVNLGGWAWARLLPEVGANRRSLVFALVGLIRLKVCWSLTREFGIYFL